MLVKSSIRQLTVPCIHCQRMGTLLHMVVDCVVQTNWNLFRDDSIPLPDLQKIMVADGVEIYQWFCQVQ